MFLDIAAVVLRFLMARTFLHEYFQTRPEISTPLNSMVRVKEGVALYKDGISPYEGDTYHGTPILLVLVHKLLEIHPILLELLFPICDLIAAVALQIAVKNYLKHLHRKESAEKPESESLLIAESSISILSCDAKLLYLYNPFSVVTCVAHATTTLNNAVIAVGLAFMVSKFPFIAIICVAIASYNEFYPFLLIAPMVLWFSMDANGCFAKNRLAKSTVMLCLVWSIVVGALFFFSKILCNGWSFLGGIYGFILSADDLTPNPGVFWYFFTEMFDHFRLFFVWVFQLNPIIYVAPLAICLRDDAVVLSHQLLTIITIFKSYPSVGDAALILSFLPALSHLNKYIRHRFIIGVSFVACMALAPVMWYLWIHAGSANANFYFAITLVYSTAHIFLLTDLLYAHLRRQLHLQHGVKPTINEKEAAVVLK